MKGREWGHGEGESGGMVKGSGGMVKGREWGHGEGESGGMVKGRVGAW